MSTATLRRVLHVKQGWKLERQQCEADQESTLPPKLPFPTSGEEVVIGRDDALYYGRPKSNPRVACGGEGITY